MLITRAALDYSGSGVGLLPLGKRVRLETLLYGLMLPSGNDAAIALAAARRRHARTGFIAMMNAARREPGAALHALHDRLGDRRPGQLLVREPTSR